MSMFAYQCLKTFSDIEKETPLLISEKQRGVLSGGDTMGVLKNSPRKAAALVFIAHITSKEQQLKKYEMLGAYPARTDIVLSKTLLTEADRANNALAWFPAPYKTLMIAEFVKNVLMK